MSSLLSVQDVKTQKQGDLVSEVYSIILHRSLLKATIYIGVCYTCMYYISLTICSVQLAPSCKATRGPIHFVPYHFKCKIQGYLFLIKITVILEVQPLIFSIYKHRYRKKASYVFLHLDVLFQVQTLFGSILFCASEKYFICIFTFP